MIRLRLVAGPAAQSRKGLRLQGHRPDRTDPRDFWAKSPDGEGALQVELAHLTYQRSRLVRSWTHLERQRGGFGFLGGPGETQIETDRRLIQERMVRIERQLEGVKRMRALHRASRSEVPYPTVALVGYTNAGKSTLFNRLTHAQVVAADMLFATLDPTMRLIKLPHGGVGDSVRHSRLHFRFADDADLRFSGDAGRGSSRRRDRPCSRHFPRRQRSPEPGCRGDPRRAWRRRPGRPGDRSLEQTRPARTRRKGHAGKGTGAA